MAHDADRTDEPLTNRRFRAGALAVVAGAGCILALWQLPGDRHLVEMAAALLALTLLVAGTLAVGTSVPHRAA